MRAGQRLACLVLAVVGCSTADEKKPAARATGAAAGDAGAKAPVSAKRKSPEAGASPAEREGRAFLDRWLTAQNQGDFAAYSALYAPGFSGVRRSGKSVKTFDRDGWLADRKRMFGEKMIVRADNPVVKADGDRTTIEFEQTWESGSYADKGPKRIVLHGGLIASEEMLASTLTVVPATSCAEALLPDPDDRKQVKDTRVFAPAGSKRQVCILEKRHDGAGEFELALLEKRGKGWVVRGETRSFSFEEESDPDNMLRKDGQLKAELVAISPKEQALLVEFETTDEEPGVSRRKSAHVLFRVKDQLDALVEHEGNADIADSGDDGVSVDIEVSKRATRGYFDIEVTLTTFKIDWVPEEREEKEEAVTRYRWDGSTYTTD